MIQVGSRRRADREGDEVKPIKTFGLAALTALMAMAPVGASSAMAEGSTALCASEQATCSSPITHLHETSVGKAKIKSSLPTIECNVLFLGDARKNKEEKALGAPLIIDGTFTYSSCNNFCSLKEENGPAEIVVLKTGTELAAVTGERLLHLSCPFINCRYTGVGLEGLGLGPLTSGPSAPNGSVIITEQQTEKESGSCPEETFLTITTTPLSATYIST